MKKSLLLVLLSLCLGIYANGQGLKADFSAAEAMTKYYSEGFDSQETNTWVFEGINHVNTWHFVDKPYIKGLPDFTVFDSESKLSLAIRYDENNTSDEKATSPVIAIQPNSQCEFYACFSGVFLFSAPWTFSVIDADTNKEDVLFNAFNWAQEVGFDGPNWEKFTIDLSAYAGKNVKLRFHYAGIGGEDLLIDGLRISKQDVSDNAHAEIGVGESVHFSDQSTGALKWNWEFEGGTPATSTERNPIVTYNQKGTFKVKLTVSDNTNTATKERVGYVVVKEVAPTSVIGLPEEGYLSPWVGCLVPLNTDVTFRDLSKGSPTKWEWQLPGTNHPKSSEQNPVVQYTNKGVYSLSLRVSNGVGINTSTLQYAVQAGGENEIWNISVEENTQLNPVALGFYGYYGGSNWLGMTDFAEKFVAPRVDAEIKSVGIYFASVNTVTPNAEITVSILTEDEKGMPGASLGSAKVLAKDLQYSETTFEKTLFTFANPVALPKDKAFFVSVSGIPNNSTDTGTDEIAMFCSPLRGEGGKCTAFHRMEEWDADGRPTGKYLWYENVADPLSLAITPWIVFKNENGGVADNVVENAFNIAFDGENLVLPEMTENVAVFSISGALVMNQSHPAEVVSLADLQAGMYVVKAVKDGEAVVVKIIKK